MNPAAPPPAWPACSRMDGRVALTGASANPGTQFARVLHTAPVRLVSSIRRAGRLQCLTKLALPRPGSGTVGYHFPGGFATTPGSAPDERRPEFPELDYLHAAARAAAASF